MNYLYMLVTSQKNLTTLNTRKYITEADVKNRYCMFCE
jgi:hypothetical protein